MASELLVSLCRASYFISLLGLKIPCGLLFRASHSRYILACLCLVWIPLLIYSHAVLLPMVPELPSGTAALVWHVFTALWFTIPLLVVGSVILSVVHARGPFMAFFGALAVMIAFHGLVIPLIATTRVGGVLLHALFAFFEDMPVVGWIWCLYHVVRMQNHIAKTQSDRQNPFVPSDGIADRVLIVGNAPTVIEGEPLGHLIDGFNHVVRFNQYTVAKPEYTGNKVGFHFCNGRNFPTDNTVKAICPLFNASLTHAVYLFMPHMEEAKDIYANLTNPKVDAWFVEEQHILELRRKIGNKIWQIPTSGMVAIDAFLRNRKQVSLHGFNFFQGKKIHYFEESTTQLITSWLERFVTHDPNIEKVWVDQLKEQNRVLLLNKHSASTTSADDCDGDAIDEGKGKKGDEDEAELRRRAPGLVHTLLKDGFPSQFSF